jgi:ADP-ribose pyrophosphatase
VIKYSNNIKFRDIENDDGFIELFEEKKIHLRVSVYVLIENEKDNKFLLIKDGRSKKWELPGGGVETNENLTQAGIREILEETGYCIDVKKQDLIYNSLDYIYNRKKDKFYQNFVFIFKGDLKNEKRVEQNLTCENEIIDFNWFSKEEIKNLEIANFHKEFFKIRGLKK